ncbi:MAG TPA: glycosyltransferase [Burkholderiales bacterium]|nr:glycosyltransferase [Burkholderiales bacterium]
MAQALSRIVMLGAAAQDCGAPAAVLEAWRGEGLFERWPIEIVAARDARAFLSFSSLLLRERGLAVHAHASARTLWRDAPFVAAALAARAPLVLQFHGGGLERAYDAASGPVRAAFHAALERAAAVVVPTESLKGWLARLSRGAPVSCIPSPVRLPALHGDAERGNLVLFLGRLEAAKGVFDLLEALAALRSCVPELRLVCAGEGDQGALARYAERLGIAEAVKLTGRVGPSGKRALFESAAAFAAPCYEAGLPLALLEAMAAGVPAVASPVGGIPEALNDGVSGFLVAPGDTATLARQLKRVLLDRELAARVAAAARASVRRRHAPERSLAQIEDLYAGLGVRPVAAPRRETPLRKAA